MKRPEETAYFRLNPTEEQLTELQKKQIESLISRDLFCIPESFGTLTPEIYTWLHDYGWKVERVQEDINEWVSYLKPADY